MNYKFYYRATGEFADNIKCVVISEDFSQQYRIYLDGHYDSVLEKWNIGFTSYKVASFIRENKWREGDIKELHLLLDKNAIKNVIWFLIKLKILTRSIPEFTGFTIIDNVKGWTLDNLVALVISNDMSNQYRVYNINGKLVVDRIKNDDRFFKQEKDIFIDKNYWKIISVKELADKFIDGNKKALYDWLINIETTIKLDDVLNEFAESDTFEIDQPELDISAEELKLCKNPDMQIFYKLPDRVKEIIKSYPTSFEYAIQQNDGSISWTKVGIKQQPQDLMIYRINSFAKSRKEIIGYSVITAVHGEGVDYYIRNDEKNLIPFRHIRVLLGYFMTEYTNYNDISGTTVLLRKETDLKFGTPIKVFFKK